jgi:rhodanese-related sulfurtransferase
MTTPVPTLGVTEAFELLRSGAPFVDVREPDEFAQLHAVGARLVPLNTIPERLHDWAQNRLEESEQPPVYLICLSGGRSHAAAAWLISQGVNAVNIAGGTQAWVAAQLPTESGVPDPGNEVSRAAFDPSETE